MAQTQIKDPDELVDYIANFVYISGAQSKKACQIMADNLVHKLVDGGLVTFDDPVKPTVLVVREPDSETDITISPPDSVWIVEADLGSSFDGTPNPDDEEQVAVAREIARSLRDGTAHLSEDDGVRQAALGWAESVTEGLPEEDEDEE